MTARGGDPLDDDQVEGAVELGVDDLLELSPVAVDQPGDAGRERRVDRRGHVPECTTAPTARASEVYLHFSLSPRVRRTWHL